MAQFLNSDETGSCIQTLRIGTNKKKHSLCHGKSIIYIKAYKRKVVINKNKFITKSK